MHSSDEAPIAHSSYALCRHNVMSKLCAAPTRSPGTQAGNVDLQLTSCPYVFMQHDAVWQPFQPPYDGLFKVLHRGEKHITMNKCSRQDILSLDRIEPAHMRQQRRCSVSAKGAPAFATSSIQLQRQPKLQRCPLGIRTVDGAQEPLLALT